MGWNLKRFADTLNFYGALPIANLFQPPPQVAISMTGQVIFDFTKPQPEFINIWGNLDDVVMGGVSSSNFILLEKSALFAGNVSTANSGGFVSLRTRNFEPALDLSAFTSMSLQVKGDGQRYKFFLRDSTGWDSLAYSFAFDTTENAWLTITIPFCQFTPVYRARSVGNAPKLNTQAIRSMQLMLSKFEVDGALNPSFRAGKFALEIAQISAV